MARAANRLRQNLRPEDRKDLQFEADEDALPIDFLQADLKVKDRRHLIFATSKQLDTLAKAKVWHCVFVFKLIRHPFQQLLTINAFVRSGEYAKQVPLVFVVMSGRKEKDYKKVFRKVMDLLSSASVQQVTVDFEKAVWKDLKSVLPEVQIQGCLFHWTQVLWRKVQELGLQVPYCNEDATYTYIRKLMALPFLPEHEIRPMFDRLCVHAQSPLYN
ncbi:hypothetical protein QZH41_016319, partial [Actinostola sp. cb2023]